MIDQLAKAIANRIDMFKVLQDAYNVGILTYEEWRRERFMLINSARREVGLTPFVDYAE